MKIGELVEGQTFHTRLTRRTGRVVEIQPEYVWVVWEDREIRTPVHNNCHIDPVGFVRPDDR